VRAILINPFDETIKEAVYTGDYREIYDLIECQTFDIVNLFKVEDDLYVDDEGLFKDNQRYFSIEGKNLAGRGLILSSDGEGESIGTTLTVEQVKEIVDFLPEGHKEIPHMEFTAWK